MSLYADSYLARIQQAAAELISDDGVSRDFRAVAQFVIAVVDEQIGVNQMVSLRRELQRLLHLSRTQRLLNGTGEAFVTLVADAIDALNIRIDGAKEFIYLPSGLQVEAVDEKGETHCGPLRCGYGTSLYDFHYEYPIEGAGVRKDLIHVIEPDGSRTPMLRWCKRNNVFISCNRCGADITYEVAVTCRERMFDMSMGKQPAKSCERTRNEEDLDDLVPDQIVQLPIREGETEKILQKLRDSANA